MELTVEIDALVVEGLEVDIDLLAAAFTHEMTRLVRERGVPIAAGGDRELAELAGLPPLGRATSAAQLGAALARSVHAGLSGWSR